MANAGLEAIEEVGLRTAHTAAVEKKLPENNAMIKQYGQRFAFTYVVVI